jgi:transcriptional regulator of acetoin/glycerol metabolism
VLGRDSLEILTEYNYRGNVRELSNVIQSSVLLCDSFEIQACHLPARILENSGGQKGELEDMQLRTVFRILSECGGNQTAAAKRLGVARGTLNRMLRRIQSV